jgi:dTDP-4-amino-4,6-dideoxygalactose transaminase
MTLALLGGRPVRTRPYPPHNTIGEEEKKSVLEVLDSGLLSGFSARGDAEFLGGPKVLALEAAFQEMFGVRHAVAFNSATSALHACVIAAGIGPGDEVITSPYTMSASATCILMQGAAPVFADIEPDTFCLDPVEVERAVSPRTKAFVPVNLFGQPAELDRIMDIAHRRGLVVIEDNAQAPGARYRGRYTGTIGHVGVFSLNRHKTIQCGEGGVAVTDDPALARRLRLVRNHGEVVAEELGWPEDAQVLGFNYRITELQAAVALVQLRKLEGLNRHRVELAEVLSPKLTGCDYLVPPRVRDGCTHVYYLYAMKVKTGPLGFSRTTLLEALKAEGIPVHGGYAKPLFRLPLFQKHRAGGPPCPVTEALYDEELLTTNVCRHPATPEDIEDIVRAVEKVGTHRAELARYERNAMAGCRASS